MTLTLLPKLTYPYMINQILKKIKYELEFKNTNYYERFSDKLNKGYYQRRLVKKIKTLPPIQLQKENAKLTLCMLSSHRNFSESIVALYSFCFWNPNLYLHYHEDGSLTDEETNQLKNIFVGIEIFRRKEQNVGVGEYLQNHNLPKCSELRKSFIFSLRLFDFILHKKTDYLLQIDSDVLFFSNPSDVMAIIEKETQNGCFNQDVMNAYTFQDEILKKYLDRPMIDLFNAGLFLHRLDVSFFNFVENIIQNEPESFKSWHLEQTLFAMYVSQKGDFVRLSEKYDLARINRNKGQKLISEHYVQSTGYDFHKDFLTKIYPTISKEA